MFFSADAPATEGEFVDVAGVTDVRQKQLHALHPFVSDELVSVDMLPWCAPLIRVSLLCPEVSLTSRLDRFCVPLLLAFRLHDVLAPSSS